MGTQVQAKTCSGSYTMMDLNKDAYGSWSPYHDGQILSEHMYKGYVLRPSDRAEYDRKMLKQIMLEHEATFKRQVHELHRLYKIQKNLMDEFQTKELYSHSVRAVTLPSNAFSSQIPSEHTKMIWPLMHHVPIVSTSNTTTNTVIDCMRPPLNFFKELSAQSSEFPMETGSLKKETDVQELQSKRPPKEMFDLQLPANVYIDSEEPENKGKANLAESSFRYLAPNKNNNPDPMNSTKLTLGSGECTSHQDDTCKLQSLQQNNFPAAVANIGKPVGQIFHNVTTSLDATNSHNLRRLSKSHGQQLASSSNLYTFLQETRPDWTLFDIESGKSGTGLCFTRPGFHNEKLTRLSASVELNPTQSHGTLLCNKVDSWSEQNPPLLVGISGVAPCLAMLNNSGPSAPGIPSGIPASPSLQYTCATPLLSALTKPVNKTNTWTPIGDLSSHMRLGNDSNPLQLNFKESSTFWNAIGHQSRSYATDMCLKQTLPSGNRDGLAIEHDGGATGLKRSCHATSSENSWLTRKPACHHFIVQKHGSQLEFGISQGNPKPNPCCTSLDLGAELRQEKVEALSLGKSHDFPSDFQVANRMQRMEMYANDGHADQVKDYSEGSPDIKDPSLENQLHTGSPVLKQKRVKSLINLNLVYTDTPHLTEMPSEELEVPSRITKSSDAIKVDSKIHVEVPLTSHSAESILCCEEQMPTCKIDDSDNTECSQEALDREAAESIIQLSSDKRHSSMDITSAPSPSATSDTLQWFSDVVLCEVMHTTFRGEHDGYKYSDDGLDDFELMTLMLEETKADDYCCRQQEPENLEEETGDASLLLTRPRRVRGRGRKQRRDFQKDILPGLASLTRLEVNEDLQILRGLMESSGRSWDVGLKRRKNGRYGMNLGTRGRKPKNLGVTVTNTQDSHQQQLTTNSLAATVTDILVSPQQLQPTDPELQVDGLMMIGWGRTTRRRQGRNAHRLPSPRLQTMIQ